ncbi:hypothetical protein [Pseudomonas sp. Pseu.R1]|uniref:hypothetical protein n=1 Tax=Pseudomonas sp. Pseu.R1 TaxID=3379818 RepID=UPI003B966F6C
MFFVNRMRRHSESGKLIRPRNYISTVHIEQSEGIQPYLIINLEVDVAGSQAVDRFSIITMNPGELDFFLQDTWNASVNIASIQYAYHDPAVSPGYTIQEVLKILSFTPGMNAYSGSEESITNSQHRYYLADGDIHHTSPEVEKKEGGRLLWGDDQDDISYEGD